MNKKHLFRQEVIESQKNRNYGSVSINTPVRYTLLTMGFSLLVIGIFLFLMLGEFSEKFIVTGYLESTNGIARVYARKSGVIRQCFIKQGEKVKKGASLFLIDTSNEGVEKKSTRDVLSHLEKKKISIEKEIAYKKQHLQSLKKLVEKKYISLTTYDEKHDEFVALKNNKNRVDVEIMNYKQSKSYVIRAPIDGMISSLIYHEGQYINLTKPLVKILPSQTDLVAELFIPVKQSGFLRRDNQVIIRFDAYPYARFGASKARIQEISQSILTDAEEDKPIRIGQPYYKVLATLDKQLVSVYGKQKHLQHGMTLSAVIVGSKRKIWEWIFDPVYSFYSGVRV